LKIAALPVAAATLPAVRPARQAYLHLIGEQRKRNSRSEMSAAKSVPMFGPDLPKQQEMPLGRPCLPRPIKPAAQRFPSKKSQTPQGLELDLAAGLAQTCSREPGVQPSLKS
jgi:hypothetical protein